MHMFEDSQDGSTNWSFPTSIIIAQINLQRKLKAIRDNVEATMRLAESASDQLRQLDRQIADRLAKLPDEDLHLPPSPPPPPVQGAASPNQPTHNRQQLQSASNRISSSFASNQSNALLPYAPSNQQPGRALHDQGQQLPPPPSMSQPEQARSSARQARQDHKPESILFNDASVVSNSRQGIAGIQLRPTIQRLALSRADGHLEHRGWESNRQIGKITSYNSHYYTHSRQRQKEKKLSIPAWMNSIEQSQQVQDFSLNEYDRTSNRRMMLSLTYQTPSKGSFVDQMPQRMPMDQLSLTGDEALKYITAPTSAASKLHLLLLECSNLSPQLRKLKREIYKKYYRMIFPFEYTGKDTQIDVDANDYTFKRWLSKIMIVKVCIQLINGGCKQLKIEQPIYLHYDAKLYRQKFKNIEQEIQEKDFGANESYTKKLFALRSQVLLACDSKNDLLRATIKEFQHLVTVYQDIFRYTAILVFGKAYRNDIIWPPYNICVSQAMPMCKKIFDNFLRNALEWQRENIMEIENKNLQFFEKFAQEHSFAIIKQYSIRESEIEDSRKPKKRAISPEKQFELILDDRDES